MAASRAPLGVVAVAVLVVGIVMPAAAAAAAQAPAPAPVSDGKRDHLPSLAITLHLHLICSHSVLICAAASWAPACQTAVASCICSPVSTS